MRMREQHLEAENRRLLVLLGDALQAATSADPASSPDALLAGFAEVRGFNLAGSALDHEMQRRCCEAESARDFLKEWDKYKRFRRRLEALA